MKLSIMQSFVKAMNNIGKGLQYLKIKLSERTETMERKMESL